MKDSEENTRIVHLNDLRSNLQELYHAIHKVDNPRLTLVANYSGTRVYNSTTGWGRVWVWFYSITECLFGSGLWLENVKKAVFHTHALFQKNLPLICYYVDQYASYFKKACDGYEVNDNEFTFHRQAITNWNQATLPFVKMVQKYQLEKLKKLFRLSFGDTENKYFVFPQFDTVRHFQKIINLEGVGQSRIPLAIVEKAAYGKKLNDSDLKEFDKWLKSLKQYSCNVRQLHQGLKAIVTELYKTKGESPDLAFLENYLEDRGCLIFQQSDPVHLQWRDNLTKGALIGSEFILGDQIGRKAWGFDRFKIYEIQNYPDLVLVIGCNQAILDMKKQRHDVQKGYGVAPVQLLGVDPNGRWAVMEKLRPLHVHKWTSTISNFTQEDQEAAMPLVALMKWLIEQNHTPKQFTPRYLMFDSLNRLNSLVPTSKGEFDFTALEEFAFHCASGNLRIFQHLMESSGLARHAVKKFYREMLINALRGDQTTVEDLGAIYNINDPKIIDQGMILQKELLRLRQVACLKCLELHSEMAANQIEQRVDQAILKVYDVTKAAGIVWPTFQGMLLSEI